MSGEILIVHHTPAGVTVDDRAFRRWARQRSWRRLF